MMINLLFTSWYSGVGGGETIAWLAGPGIYFATLKLILPPNSSNHLAERQLLQYSDLGLGAVGVGSNDDDADNEAFAPLSMALTEFHFLLLYPMKVLAVNRQSGTVVQEMRLSGIVESHSPILTDERMQACYLLVRHPARLLVVDAFDEARDMWRVHLEKKQFDRALEFANEEQQAIVLGFSCYARLTRWFRDENNNIVTAFVGRRHLVVVVVTVLDYFLFHCSRPVSELSGTVVKLTQVPSCLVDRCFRLT